MISEIGKAIEQLCKENPLGWSKVGTNRFDHYKANMIIWNVSPKCTIKVVLANDDITPMIPPKDQEEIIQLLLGTEAVRLAATDVKTAAKISKKLPKTFDSVMRSFAVAVLKGDRTQARVLYDYVQDNPHLLERGDSK